jgi:capsular exopolysaccharide synthesis family protein
MDFEESGGELNLRRYLSAVRRYKWLILLVTLLGSIAGYGASWFMQPVYTAHTTIWMEGGSARQATLGQPIQSGQLLQSFAWLDLLRSFAVLDKVVMEQRLFVQPVSPADASLFQSFELDAEHRTGEFHVLIDDAGTQYILKTRAGEEVERGRTGDPIGRGAGFRWEPPATALRPGREIGFTVARPRDAAVELQAELRSRIDRDGNFLRVELRGTNPQQIAATLNSVSERFVELAAELKRDKVDELESILEQQLRHAEDYLRQAEIALEGFRVQTITLPSETETPVAAGLDMTRTTVFGRFFDRKLQQEELRHDRQAIQQVLDQMRQGSEVPVMALELIGSVSASTELKQALAQLTSERAELRAARRQYTDEHPMVREILARIQTLEGQTIPALAQDVVRHIAAREADLGEIVDAASNELRAIPPRMSEEARLRRQVSTAETLYTTLRRRYEEVRLAALTSIPDMRLLDRAVPPRWPVQDDRSRMMLLAMMGSFGFALLGAVILDKMDPRLRYPEEVTRLGLTTLGAVPHLGNGKRSARSTQSAERLVEAFRGIRVNLTYAYGQAGPVLLTISSPGPGDGKSFVSSNLAHAFAQAGQRTLLIDADVRRGALHQMFGRSRKPGLTDYLKGDADWDDIVLKTRYPLISLISAGTRHQNAPELLGSPAMGELLSTALQGRYGVILVDSPPLGAAVDPLILANWTRNLLLVLRTGNTNRELTELKLDVINRLPIRLLGAVLNDVPSSGPYRYYAYAAGYEVEKELPGPGSRLPAHHRS